MSVYSLPIRIPNGIIIPLFIASFILFAYQYFRLNPMRRLLQLQFSLMIGAIALSLASVFMAEWSLSPVFFLLALFWLGLSIFLLRRLPPGKR